jgi:Rhodanese-like domain
MRVTCRQTAALLFLLGAGLAQAAQLPPPGEDIRIEFIQVKQVAQLLSDGALVQLVDVRSRQDYLIRHIKGAISIPIDNIEIKSRDIPRDGIVVLY